MTVPWEISIPLALGAGLGALSTPTAIRVSQRFGLFDQPARHKRHKRPVPLLGGAALFVSVWLAVGVSIVLFFDYFREFAGQTPYIFAGALIIFLVGLSDDLSPVSAWVKILAQAGAGLILYMGDLGIDTLTIPFAGTAELGTWSALITVLWVVGLSNAVNVIDGLDGLATGVSLIGAVSLAVLGVIYEGPEMVLPAVVLIGFLVTFLIYNRHPARIFLGDSGSLQLGYYFAVISLLVPIRTYTTAALYLPLLCLGVPILEIAIAFWRRLISGRNVLKADRRHVFHYLALAGLSPRKIVYLFYGVSAVFGLFSIAMVYLDRRLVFALLVLFMVVIFSLFYFFMSHLNRSDKRRIESGHDPHEHRNHGSDSA